MEKKQENMALTFYASIECASGNMLKAAQNRDWNSLCEAEKLCIDLITRLQLAQIHKTMTREDWQERIPYLKKILANDAAIRHITEPRFQELEKFLNMARAAAPGPVTRYPMTLSGDSKMAVFDISYKNRQTSKATS